jgi:hypothetical protein
VTLWAALLLPLVAVPDTAGAPADTTLAGDSVRSAPGPDAALVAGPPASLFPTVGSSGLVSRAADTRGDEPPSSLARSLRPIRTNTPGTGVFIGSGLVVQTLYDRESAAGEELSTWTAVADYRYTPATHWVFGARAPWILDRTLESPSPGSVSTSGAGDVSLAVKHRFFRSVGMWSDRHMAAEVEVKLPTGDGVVPPGAEDLPARRRHRLAPGSGSVDVVADLIYQEGRRRFIYGGDLSFRLNTQGNGGYRFGNEVRLNLDLEYILFPLEYRRPGNEVFVLLETTLRRKWADEVRGRSLERTERTDLLLAPAVQHIISDQLLASLSVQFPAISDAPAGGLEQDLDVLAELRYAF